MKMDAFEGKPLLSGEDQRFLDGFPNAAADVAMCMD